MHVKAFSKLSAFAVLAFSLILFSGCADLFQKNSSASSSSGNTAEASGPDYYYGDFEDVPIPSALSKDGNPTTIHTATGVKAGVQSFKGRVEVTSLNNFMINAMTREGWAFKAAFRSDKSVLVFEKNDKFCIIYNTDGTMNTTMQLFITPKVGSSPISLSAPAGGISSGYSNPIGE